MGRQVRPRAASVRAMCPIALLTAVMTTAAAILAGPGVVCAQEKPGNPPSQQIAKAVGKIKSVQGNSITVTPASGADVVATLSAPTKILSVPPGAKDLTGATTLQPADLQPGDTVRVRGYAAANGGITALEVLVFKQSQIAAKQQHDREDWQKRGVDGTVAKVDAASGTITISRGGLGAKQSIVVHVSKDTMLRRYAPGSVNFDDAKPAPIDQIKVGDQLNARGDRTADGGEMKAEEIVSGTFNYVEGTIKVVNAADNTITVQDALSKSAVVVKVTSDSLLKKLPPEMAQRIAARWKAMAGGADQPSTGGQSQSAHGQDTSGHDAAGAGGSRAGTESHGAGAGGPGGGGGPGGNGAPDLQRMLSRVPNATLADLQKDDAVMIVATASGDSGTMNAIKVLAGVDPILRAAPNASSLLSSWSLGSPGGEGDAGAQQ